MWGEGAIQEASEIIHMRDMEYLEGRVGKQRRRILSTSIWK